MYEIIKHYLCTRQEYDNIPLKNANSLYFIRDAHEIYKGSELYSGEGIIFVEKIPPKGIRNKLYITQAQDIYMWNGVDWKLLLSKISNVLDTETKGLVSAEAIRNYIKKVTNGSISTIVTETPIIVNGVNLGTYADGDVIPSGTNLENILKGIFAKKILPVYIAPKIEFNHDLISNIYEVGTVLTPTLVTKFIKNDAGALYKHELYKINNETNISTKIIDNSLIKDYIDSITVLDNDAISYKSVVSYAQGAIKKDNFGFEYESGRVQTGKIQSIMNFVGKRRTFFGCRTDFKINTTIDSNYIRGLDSILGVNAGESIYMDIQAGTNSIVIAYPKVLGELKNVISKKLNLDIKDVFVKSQVEVTAFNNKLAIDYNVYTYIPEISYPAADNISITIGGR